MLLETMTGNYESKTENWDNFNINKCNAMFTKQYFTNLLNAFSKHVDQNFS